MCLLPCLIMVFTAIFSIFYIYYGRLRDIDVPPAESWRYTTWYRLEYEQLSEGIRARDSVTIIAGTILITASILLLGTTIELKFEENINAQMESLMILASLSIYIIWLLCFNLTSKMVNNMGYKRLMKMEEVGCSEERLYEGSTCGIHHFYGEQMENTRWKHVRRHVWLFFFWALVTISIMILLIPT